MSNNDNNKGRLNDGENKENSIGFGLIYGAAFGIIFGMVSDRILIGIVIGPSLGLILGTIIDSNKKSIGKTDLIKIVKMVSITAIGVILISLVPKIISCL